MLLVIGILPAYIRYILYFIQALGHTRMLLVSKSEEMAAKKEEDEIYKIFKLGPLQCHLSIGPFQSGGTV